MMRHELLCQQVCERVPIPVIPSPSPHALYVDTTWKIISNSIASNGHFLQKEKHHEGARASLC